MEHQQNRVHLLDVEHFRIAGREDTYCAWPWTGGIENFGGGEIAITFTERPCAYRTLDDVEHHETGARQVLLRSFDGGQTWPEGERVVLRDNRIPFNALFPEGWGEDQRETIDMFQPDAVLSAWRSREKDPPVAFVLRSADKGRTWERVPIVLDRFHLHSIWGGTHYLKRPSGVLLLAMGGYAHPGRPGRSVLYGSTDHGLHWYYVSTIGYEWRDEMTCHYPCPVALPNGRILCTLGYRLDKGGVSWTSLVHSYDEGWTWSGPRRINRWGDNAFLLRLRDGRLVCVWGYRFPSYGIRGAVSGDEGSTWSEEFVIREDGGSGDLGYPVATELEDGRIFTAYYFNVEDGVHLNGGRRFIAGSTFRIKD